MVQRPRTRRIKGPTWGRRRKKFDRVQTAVPLPEQSSGQEDLDGIENIVLLGRESVEDLPPGEAVVATRVLEDSLAEEAPGRFGIGLWRRPYAQDGHDAVARIDPLESRGTYAASRSSPSGSGRPSST
jgi:hypothetical protein